MSVLILTGNIVDASPFADMSAIMNKSAHASHIQDLVVANSQKTPRTFTRMLRNLVADASGITQEELALRFGVSAEEFTDFMEGHACPTQDAVTRNNWIGVLRKLSSDIVSRGDWQKLCNELKETIVYLPKTSHRPRPSRILNQREPETKVKPRKKAGPPPHPFAVALQSLFGQSDLQIREWAKRLDIHYTALSQVLHSRRVVTREYIQEREWLAVLRRFPLSSEEWTQGCDRLEREMRNLPPRPKDGPFSRSSSPENSPHASAAQEQDSIRQAAAALVKRAMRTYGLTVPDATKLDLPNKDLRAANTWENILGAHSGLPLEAFRGAVFGTCVYRRKKNGDESLRQEALRLLARGAPRISGPDTAPK